MARSPNRSAAQGQSKRDQGALERAPLARLPTARDRALGRWHFRVPGLFGGSKKKSEEHLRRSLTYNPDSTASHFFLAETLFELGRDREARDELTAALAAPLNPEWEPEDLEFKQKAKERLGVR